MLKIITVLTISFLSIFLIFSCNSRKKKGKTSSSVFNSSSFNEGDFSDEVRKALPFDTSAKWNYRSPHTVREWMARMYAKNDYAPIWYSDKNTLGNDLVKDLRALEEDGLNPKNYFPDAIEEQMKKMKADNMASILSFDTLCSNAYIKASKDLLLGALNPLEADSTWYHSNDSNYNPEKFLLNNIAKDDKYVSLDSFKSHIPTYALLKKELKRYADLKKNTVLTALKDNLTLTKTADTHTIAIVKQELGNFIISDSAPSNIKYVAVFQNYYGLNPNGKIDSTTFPI